MFLNAKAQKVIGSMGLEVKKHEVKSTLLCSEVYK